MSLWAPLRVRVRVRVENVFCEARTDPSGASTPLMRTRLSCVHEDTQALTSTLPLEAVEPAASASSCPEPPDGDLLTTPDSPARSDRKLPASSKNAA